MKGHCRRARRSHPIVDWRIIKPKGHLEVRLSDVAAPVGGTRVSIGRSGLRLWNQEPRAKEQRSDPQDLARTGDRDAESSTPKSRCRTGFSGRGIADIPRTIRLSFAVPAVKSFATVIPLVWVRFGKAARPFSDTPDEVFHASFRHRGGAAGKSPDRLP